MAGTTVPLCYRFFWSSGGGSYSCLVVVVAGAGLVSSPPSRPAAAEGAFGGLQGRGGEPEQPAGFGDADLDHADVLGWCFVCSGRECSGVLPVRRHRGGRAGSIAGWRGGVGRAGGGDGEQGQGAHGQHGVAVEGVPQADLVLVQPGLSLALLEALFSRPPLIPIKKKSSLAFRVHPGRY